MNRDELLDKLAMERDAFPESIIDPTQHMPVGWTPAYGPRGIVYLELASGAVSSIDENDWTQRRKELINCPPDSEAPGWAKWKAQLPFGGWMFFESRPDIRYFSILGEESWSNDGLNHKSALHSNGEIPAGHNWRTTLTRINRDDNTSTPEEEEEFARIQARQDAERPHEADARRLDEQLAEAMGRKLDAEKPRFDLLIKDMPLALEAVARVLTFGASKYADGNWQYVENADKRYLAASMRHELALSNGQENDDETGEHHIAHKLCCDLFRLELALRNR